MTACPFCLDKSAPYGDILMQTPLAYVLSNDDPVLSHAVMIIPLRHIATPFELSPAEWLEIHHLMLASRRIMDAYGPQGYTLGWNVGDAGGQHVAHVHLHMIARFSDEPLAGQGLRHALKQEANRRPSASDKT